MDQQTIVAEIEERARDAGVTISAVCERAGVHPTTFSRWKRTARNPEPIGATLASIRKLQDALRHFETEHARRMRRRKVAA